MAVKIGGNLVIGPAVEEPPVSTVRDLATILEELKITQQEQTNESSSEQTNNDKKISQYTMDMNINLDNLIDFN